MGGHVEIVQRLLEDRSLLDRLDFLVAQISARRISRQARRWKHVVQVVGYGCGLAAGAPGAAAMIGGSNVPDWGVGGLKGVRQGE